MRPRRQRASLWPQKTLWVYDECGSSDISVPRSVGLTKRQAEVLAWVARGKTNKEIGAILAISWRTVQKHLEQTYQKMGVETRTAALAVAVDLNTIAESPEQPLAQAVNGTAYPTGVGEKSTSVASIKSVRGEPVEP